MSLVSFSRAPSIKARDSGRRSAESVRGEEPRQEERRGEHLLATQSGERWRKRSAHFLLSAVSMSFIDVWRQTAPHPKEKSVWNRFLERTAWCANTLFSPAPVERNVAHICVCVYFSYRFEPAVFSSSFFFCNKWAHTCSLQQLSVLSSLVTCAFPLANQTLQLLLVKTKKAGNLRDPFFSNTATTIISFILTRLSCWIRVMSFVYFYLFV